MVFLLFVFPKLSRPCQRGVTSFAAVVASELRTCWRLLLKNAIAISKFALVNRASSFSRRVLLVEHARDQSCDKVGAWLVQQQFLH